MRLRGVAGLLIVIVARVHTADAQPPPGGAQAQDRHAALCANMASVVDAKLKAGDRRAAGVRLSGWTDSTTS
jgi:hypothetical protein